MTSLLTPITISDHKFLIKIFAQCLDNWEDWKILDQELGSPQRGTIDLLAVDQEKKPYLITIGHINIEEGLIRCLTGYRWFKENQSILKRVFSSQDLDFELPVKLVLLAEQVIPEASKLAQDISKIPICIYRYTCFGPKEDPRIYVEPLNSYPIPPYAKPPVKIEPRSESKLPNLEDIRKRLRIELADLSDQEVDEFLNLDLP